MFIDQSSSHSDFIHNFNSILEVQEANCNEQIIFLPKSSWNIGWSNKVHVIIVSSLFEPLNSLI